MNVEIPRHLKEISDGVDLLRSSSLLVGTQGDDLQNSSQLMQSRRTMLTKHGMFPTLVEDAPPSTKSKLAYLQSKSSAHRNSKHRHKDDTDSSSNEEEPIGSGSSSDSEVEVRRTSKRNSSHSTRNKAVSSSRRSFPGLNELLVPANSKFKKVLSYKTFRLDDKNQSEDANVRKRLGKLFRIFNVSLGDHNFDGFDPISVLAFLANFCEECNSNAVPEGAAKLLLKHFLRGRARDAFISTLNVGSEGSSHGRRSYPGAVQCLLLNYAQDTYIHDSVTELRDLTQKEHETEQEFGNRLAQKYSRFAGVFSIEDQVAQYSGGLHGTIAANVARDIRLNADKFTTIDEMIDLADSYGRAERARYPKASKSILRDTPRLNRGKTVMIEGSPSTISGYGGSRASTHGDGILVIDEGGYSPPTDYDSVSYWENTESSAGNSEGVHAVMKSMNPRLEDWAQPTRPGWQVRPDGSRNPSNLDPIKVLPRTDEVCFICIDANHYVPDFPLITPEARVRAIERLLGLPANVLAKLPRYSFLIAGLQPPPKPNNYAFRSQSQTQNRNPRDVSGREKKLLQPFPKK